MVSYLSENTSSSQETSETLQTRGNPFPFSSCQTSLQNALQTNDSDLNCVLLSEFSSAFIYLLFLLTVCFFTFRFNNFVTLQIVKSCWFIEKGKIFLCIIFHRTKELKDDSLVEEFTDNNLKIPFGE